MPPRSLEPRALRSETPLVLAASASVEERRQLSAGLKEAGFDVRCVDAAADAEAELRAHAGTCVLVIDSGLLEMVRDCQWRSLRDRHPRLGTVVRCWIPRNPGIQRTEPSKVLVHPDDDESLRRAVRTLVAEPWRG